MSALCQISKFDENLIRAYKGTVAEPLNLFARLGRAKILNSVKQKKISKTMLKDTLIAILTYFARDGDIERYGKLLDITGEEVDRLSLSKILDFIEFCLSRLTFLSRCSPTLNEVTVFRGIKGRPEKQGELYYRGLPLPRSLRWERLKVGQKITSKGPMSTSSDIKVATNFQDDWGYLMCLTICKGIPILNLGYLDDENEILLPPGSRIIIKKIRKKKRIVEGKVLTTKAFRNFRQPKWLPRWIERFQSCKVSKFS